MTNPDTIARGIIERWRPYMKVFGPNKGFPKNKISMLEEITAALREYGEEQFHQGRLLGMKESKNIVEGK